MSKNSAKYGKPVWVTLETYRQLYEIIGESMQNSQSKITPNAVISDLLSLYPVPKMLLEKLKQEKNPEKRQQYADILTFIMDEEKNVRRQRT